ncbi:MAG: hypothetical protein MR024_01685 [Firmicutes bacterium]|nr:hypothetical protein [Bacillota bacterium]
MPLEKYKNELKKLEITEPNQKLLKEVSHTLTIRQEDFKIFFLSEQEEKIAYENEFNEIESLNNYERILNAGENGN